MPREERMDVSTVLKKLQYKGQSPVFLLHMPEEARPLLKGLEAAAAQVSSKPEKGCSFAIVFAKSFAEGQEVAVLATQAVEGDALVWFVYPKQTSKRYKADVNRDTAWTIFEPLGWRAVSQVAIDDDWSALRFRRS